MADIELWPAFPGGEGGDVLRGLGFEKVKQPNPGLVIWAFSFFLCFVLGGCFKKASNLWQRVETGVRIG